MGSDEQAVWREANLDDRIEQLESALRSQVEMMEWLIDHVEDYSNDDVRDYLRAAVRATRSLAEGSNDG